MGCGAVFMDGYLYVGRRVRCFVVFIHVIVEKAGITAVGATKTSKSGHQGNSRGPSGERSTHARSVRHYGERPIPLPHYE